MGFSERFPRWTSALIGIAMVALTAAIIGLELGSCYIDLAHGTIWVGFWAGIIFIKTSLLMLFISKLFYFCFSMNNSSILFSMLLPWSVLCDLCTNMDQYVKIIFKLLSE